MPAGYGETFSAAGAAAQTVIDHLFETTARIWRPAHSRGTLREDVTTYTPQAAPAWPNCKVNRPQAPQADVGPGLDAEGKRTLYMGADADVLRRDVLELTAGPDAPALLEADEVTRPRGHHTEVRCIVWHGTLPAEGS